MGIRYSDSSLKYYDNQPMVQGDTRPDGGSSSQGFEALARAVIDRDQSALHWLAAYHNIDLADALEQRAILARVREERTARQVYPSGRV